MEPSTNPEGKPTNPNSPDSQSDPWAHLRNFTRARIALGRTGGSQRIDSVLDFRLSHARARDAVHAVFSPETIASELQKNGLESQTIQTAVQDRKTYLVRPDLGRRLSDSSRRDLISKADEWGPRDLAIILSDGLSAFAAHNHAVETATRLAQKLRQEGWSLYPILLAPYGRVKLQDEIGEILHARHTLMLLGERPGLGSPDSLGAYFTHKPKESCSDADRNCISNIRSEGLPPREAANKLATLLSESARLGLSGVALKDMGNARELLAEEPQEAQD
ncbi:MAG: ethanolamine ammonia-lyase subunit EutC [Puniceicoccales bacterium]